MSDLAPGDTIWAGAVQPSLMIVKSVHFETTPPALSYAWAVEGSRATRFWARLEDEGVRWCRDTAGVTAMHAAAALVGNETEPFFSVLGPPDAPTDDNNVLSIARGAAGLGDDK